MLLSLFIGIEFGGVFGWGSYNTKSTSSLIIYHGATALSTDIINSSCFNEIQLGLQACHTLTSVYFIDVKSMTNRFICALNHKVHKVIDSPCLFNLQINDNIANIFCLISD